MGSLRPPPSPCFPRGLRLPRPLVLDFSEHEPCSSPFPLPPSVQKCCVRKRYIELKNRMLICPVGPSPKVNVYNGMIWKSMKTISIIRYRFAGQFDSKWGSLARLGGPRITWQTLEDGSNMFNKSSVQEYNIIGLVFNIFGQFCGGRRFSLVF